MIRHRMLLSHPLWLVSVVVLAVNDHYLKANYPSWLTGKLSDFAGMVVAPLVVVAAGEFIRPQLAGHRRRTSIGAALLVGFAFGIIQMSAVAADLYRSLGFIIDVPRRLVGASTGQAPRLNHIADVSDLVALPMLGLSVWIASKNAETGGSLEPDRLHNMSSFPSGHAPLHPQGQCPAS